MLLRYGIGWWALSLVTACGDSAPNPDAGLETGRDIRAEVDAPMDARSDPGQQDRGVDTALDAGAEETRWSPIEDIPHGCVVETADNPETLLDNRWVPCSRAEGCLTLVQDSRVQRSYSAFASSVVDDVGFFNVIQARLDDPSQRRTVVLAATDGQVLGAWRDPVDVPGRLCQVGRAVTDATRAAVFFNTRLESGAHSTLVLDGPTDRIRNLTTPTVQLTEEELPGANFAQFIFVTPSTLVLTIAPGGFLWVIEGDDRRRLSHLDSPIEGPPSNTQLVGDHLLWEDWGSPVRVAHGSMEEEGAPFLELPDGDIKGFATDGETMVWQQLYDKNPDGSYDRVEVWTAPYVRRAEDVEGRLVRTIPGRHPQVCYGAGVYAYVTERAPDAIELVDVADGRSRTIRLPVGTASFGEPLYISEEEIMIGTFQGLRRYDLSTIPYDE